jgi:hypothetical protein
LGQNGYNIAPTNPNDNIIRHREETRKFMSNKRKGKTQHPNTYKAIMAANLGSKRNADTKLKMSIAGKGRVVSKESSEKGAAKTRGKVFKNRRKLLLLNEDHTIISYFNTSDDLSKYLNISASFIRTSAARQSKVLSKYYVFYEWYPLVSNRSKFKPIVEIDDSGAIVNKFNSSVDCAKFYGVELASVRHYLRGTAKSMKGITNKLRYDII